MGFMDRLRSMAAVVTGGGATVQVEAIEPTQDGPYGDQAIFMTKSYFDHIVLCRSAG